MDGLVHVRGRLGRCLDVRQVVGCSVGAGLIVGHSTIGSRVSLVANEKDGRVFARQILDLGDPLATFVKLSALVTSNTTQKASLLL